MNFISFTDDKLSEGRKGLFFSNPQILLSVSNAVLNREDSTQQFSAYRYHPPNMNTYLTLS